jgi:hypothetical protein
MLQSDMIIGKTDVINYETMEEDLNAFLKAKDPDLLEKNLIAIKRGIELGKA